MDDPWHLITEEPSNDMTIQRGKENLSFKCTNSSDGDSGYNILKSDVHWHNSEPVSSDVFEYLLADKPDVYNNEIVGDPVSYRWHIDSSTGIENSDKTDNTDDCDNKSETSSTSSMNSDVCNSVDSYAAITIPYIDIPTEASCGILKDVNYEYSQVPSRRTKKEKPIKISPIFQSDPYFTNQRMLINKRQNDRLCTLSSTFKYLNNNLPPYVKCGDVRDNTKLGILRRAIKYINVLSELLEEDDNRQIQRVEVLRESSGIGVSTDVKGLGDSNDTVKSNTCVELLRGESTKCSSYVDPYNNSNSNNANRLIQDGNVKSNSCVGVLGNNNIDNGDGNNTCINFFLEDSDATSSACVGVLGDNSSDSTTNPCIEFIEEHVAVKCDARVALLSDDNNTNDSYADLLEEIDNNKNTSFVELVEDANT